MEMIINLSSMEKMTEHMLMKTIKEVRLAYEEPIGGKERIKLEKYGKMGFFSKRLERNINNELINTKVGHEIGLTEDNPQNLEVYFDKEMNLLDFGSSKYDLTIIIEVLGPEEIDISFNGLMEEYLIDFLPEIKYLVYETEGFPIRPSSFEKYITDMNYRKALQVTDIQPTTEEVQVIKMVENFFNIELRKDLTFKNMNNSLTLAEHSNLYKAYLLPTVEILSVFIKDNRVNNNRKIKVKLSVSEEILLGKEKESYMKLVRKLNDSELINGRLSIMY